MGTRVFTKEVPSTDGIHTLRGKIYEPDEPIVGVFQIVHGMTEHIERYDAIMKKLSQLGYVVFGYDHLGHGKTAESSEELGFFASRDGWKILCEDVAAYANAVREQYGSSLPWILLGHSMGSFIVRLTAVNVQQPDKLIIMGTGGPNPAASAGLNLIRILKKIKGERGYSDLVEKMAFGSYNSHFPQDNRYHWLTKDEKVKAAYAADPFCTFRFTLSALGDLIHLNIESNTGEWFEKISEISKNMPILIVSGKDDPVGDYGKGVKEVYRRIKKHGGNAVMRLYEDCRHEILNDTCRKEVASDIRVFLREF